MINYATNQLTAPGSTFKMVSSTAGLLEGTITPQSTVNCTGILIRSHRRRPAGFTEGEAMAP